METQEFTTETQEVEKDSAAIETTTESDVTTDTEQETLSADSEKGLKETLLDIKNSKKTTKATTESTPQAAESEWQPSYKYKVNDKELEFDETLKPLVASAEVEKKIRELYEKSAGIDEIKSKRDHVLAERDELKNQYAEVSRKTENIVNELKKLGGHIKSDDLDSAFEQLNISPEKVKQWAIAKFQEDELPADQKAIIFQNRQLQKEKMAKDEAYQSLKMQIDQISYQNAVTELNLELSKPDIQNIINEFDTRVGQQGAFRAEVIRRGQWYESVHKQSPSTSQLVAEVSRLYGNSTMSKPGSVEYPQGQHQSQVIVQNQQTKPVITGFSGASSNKSPMRKTYNSLEDLRKAKEELQQQA